MLETTQKPTGEMTYPAIQMQQLTEEFALFEDWEDKYAYLIDLGKKLEPLEEQYKISANKVTGCTSQVWFIAFKKPDCPNQWFFRADSDAYIVKGLIAILLRIFSGCSAEEIQQTDIKEFFCILGLKNHLTPTRSNGFFAMVNRITQLAVSS